MGTHQQLAKLDLTATASNSPNNIITTAIIVRDQGLGSTLDQELTFAPQSSHPLPMPGSFACCSRSPLFSLPVPSCDRLPPLLLPLLSTPLSQLYFTTALTLHVSLLSPDALDTIQLCPGDVRFCTCLK